MALTTGSRIGPYEIKSPVGEGGMGVVFRALDTKLQRDVALKLLPDHFVNDVDRLSRFQREAQVLATLNHPNIAQIYGLEESNDTRCMVMELVDGETLQERLKRGPFPIDEALTIAKQIAEALEAAHEKGIIHRDLKPGNVKVTLSGHVKVLDFGLAKVREIEEASPNLSNSPTLMMRSSPGMILGTAAYMSPEQAKGREVDRTSDVWAFGCVLYEMLTGSKVFEGETVGEILAGVFKAEPDWHRLPAETPEGIRRLLRRCLQKDRKLRFRDSGDVRIEIEDAQSGSLKDSDFTPSPLRRRERLAWISAVALLTLIAAVAIVSGVRTSPPAHEMRFEIVTPPASDIVSLAISPDGQNIIFVGTSDGISQLWLRSLDAVTARPLAGTGGATHPFWSPNNRSVAFFADGKLKRIDIDAGSVHSLTDAPGPRGGAWNGDNTIVFAPRGSDGIFRISGTGGELAPVTQLGAQQVSHRFPQFLPDGRHFLFYVAGTAEVRGVYIGQLDGPETRRLLYADAAAVYAPSGQILFARRETLFAQNFDPVRLALTGNPYQVAEHVAVSAELWVAALSASAAGPIVYRTGSAGGERQFVWFGRSGNEIGKVGNPDNSGVLNPTISPDGRRLAVQRTVGGNLDIWLFEIVRGVPSRFTVDIAGDRNPLWSPDGSRIVFSSNRRGVYDLYQREVAGATGSEKLLLATEQNKVGTDWSPDGRFLLYRVQDPKMGFDIWALPLEGDQKPFPVLQTSYEEREPQFSPDGKWIAYQSNETGRFEIYVQMFPGLGSKSPITDKGGAQPRRRHDGKELFYIAPDSRLIAVPIRFASNAQSVEVGTPVPMFAARLGETVPTLDRQQYIVSADGERFLLNTVTSEAISPITVVLNWNPSAKK